MKEYIKFTKEILDLKEHGVDIDLFERKIKQLTGGIINKPMFDFVYEALMINKYDMSIFFMPHEIEHYCAKNKYKLTDKYFVSLMNDKANEEDIKEYRKKRDYIIKEKSNLKIHDLIIKNNKEVQCHV